MAATIKVTLIGVESSSRLLRNADLVEGPIAKYLEEASDLLVRRAQRYAPKDTGHLRQSIHAEFGKGRAIVDTGVKYAPFVEFGTHAHMPRLRRLFAWAARHNRNPFFVRWSILQKGTPKKPFLGRALLELESKIDSLHDKMIDRITRKWKNG